METLDKSTQFSNIANHLSQVGRELCQRGWALGTSGNFSAVVTRDPLTLAITSTGIDKGSLRPEKIVQIDEQGNSLESSLRASAEARLHLMIAGELGANAVLHTHSVWSTLLSELEASQAGISIEGYEMLKGLRGVTTHQHQEWLPIFENSQDMAALSDLVKAQLRENPNRHGFLLRGHGLYTWGGDISEAKRHVEILEFLLEVMGRMVGIKEREASAVAYESRLALAKR
jgi:methylthioribulose-1-phosphate dehydratase